MGQWAKRAQPSVTGQQTGQLELRGTQYVTQWYIVTSPACPAAWFRARDPPFRMCFGFPHGIHPQTF